jgi:hypothetical protein
LYLYAKTDRASSYPTFAGPTPSVIDRETGVATRLDAETLRAFAELTIANELDVFAHSAELSEQHGRQAARLFCSWRSLIGARARADLDAWLTRR